MPEQPKEPKGQQPSRPPGGPDAAPSSTVPVRTPPQGAGVDPKPFVFGAPPRYVKYNIAVRVLADPIARETFSQPYSGQRRLWGS